ncbi:MAG: hypothetical protein AAGD86_07675, partial [Pseudomonadota bacterium]
MSTYISRIRPRKQAVVTGRIASLERYDKFYDLTWEALDKRAFPMLATNAGQVFVRVANSAHTADLQAARTVPPAPFSAGSLHNRYSGIRPDGTPGQGALYMASLPGLLRELTHYQTGGGFGKIFSALQGCSCCLHAQRQPIVDSAEHLA